MKAYMEKTMVFQGCMYKDFMNYNPKMFYGNERVVRLTRWIEKIESIFQISLCAEENKV